MFYRARKLRRTSIYTRPTGKSILYKLNNDCDQNQTNDLHDIPVNAFQQFHYKKNISSVDIKKDRVIEAECQKNCIIDKPMKNALSNLNGGQKINSKPSHFQYTLGQNEVTPSTTRKRPILSVIGHHVESLETINKVAPCTPQPPSDPTVVLKKKLKLRMEAEIKDKVSLMPPSSPYALICETDKVSELYKDISC